jgi:hypothetical protein
VYRLTLKQWPELVEHLRDENERLTTKNEYLRVELVAANRLLFRLGYAQARLN